ncbi:MAG: hypothetical protein WEC84_00930 [Candidatus Andersenbacteria bacterium]
MSSLVIPTRAIALGLLKAGTLSLRDVDGGEEPYLYSSGNNGPGYVMVKSLGGCKPVFRQACIWLAAKVAAEHPQLDWVAANATGGMPPGVLVSEYLEHFLGKTIPYVYIRGTRKRGGHGELITNLPNNPDTPSGSSAVVMEELVNFASTTCNSAVLLREEGYRADHACCILYYGNPEAEKALQRDQVGMTYLLTLSTLLEVAEEEGTHPAALVQKYREFLANPLKWQSDRGFEPRKEGGTL